MQYAVKSSEVSALVAPKVA